MLDFTTASFAFAGLAAAAGPVVIHLLNRRRFHVVPWAAMDFLREALQRQRRILQVRDLVLLVLRVLALVFLGLALARPFFTGGNWGRFTAAGMLTLFVLTAGCAASAVAVASAKWRGILGALSGASLVSLIALFTWTWKDHSAGDDARSSSRVPVHAVLVIDNSRSLGVETAAGTLLDRAKTRASQFFDVLPPESRITLIPLAGSIEPFPQDAFRSKDEARRALERIRLVDVAGDVTAALEDARAACESTPELPTKRVAVLTDLQTSAWSHVDWNRWAKALPGLQIAPLAQDERENVWISQFELEDGIAGTEAPARFLVQIASSDSRHLAPRDEGRALQDAGSSNDSGLSSRGARGLHSVQVTLTVDSVEVGSQVVDIAPGQTRALEFTHQFDVSGAPGRSQGTPCVLHVQPESRAADQLSRDNTAVLMAPVVTALPIVFVDQWGDQENIAQGRVGETYALRHLLAPRLADELSPRRLIQAIHVRPEQITESLLETARLVIVAGVESPGEMTPVLREYVIQGGPLMVLAGGGFDPPAWQEGAWLDGDGVLAAPLLSQSIGALPQESSIPKPFFADFETMQHDYFVVSGEDPATLSSLFNVTPFFKAVQADVSRETLDAWKEQALPKAADDLQFLRDREPGRVAPDAAGSFAEARWRKLEPSWWAWRSPLPLWDRTMTAAQLVEIQQPRALAWFQGGQTPWVIERRVGAGKMLLWTSGVTSDWNLLRSSSAMYVFHRACHQLLEDTLPRRNFNGESGSRCRWPWPMRTAISSNVPAASAKA